MTQGIKILHVTDLHLFSDQQKTLVGINPYQTLLQIITRITNDIQQNTPQLIVITGDISQDYSIWSYQTTKKLFQQFQCPLVATMGNHDHLSSFNKVFGSPSQIVTKISSLTNWRIIVLSTHWTRHVGGQLTDNTLAFLKQSLETTPNQPVIIFLHHQVLPIESEWIDQIKLQNDTQFLELIDQYKNIKAVICGHVHQDTMFERKGVLFLSTPSTSWQFTVKSKYFKLDSLMPGYRWINLYEDGTIQTEVIRIDYNKQFVPDVTSKGY